MSYIDPIIPHHGDVAPLLGSSLSTFSGWEEELLKIVHSQGSLNTLPKVDLQPFLDLLEQSSGQAAKPSNLDNDVKDIVKSEE